MSTINVLIVDDSVTIRAVVEQLLVHDHRFRVAGIAANVGEARTMMRTIAHDVVTLDLAMPGMNGLEFLDELSSRSHVPVVVLSSATKNGTEAEADALARGAAACFDKAKVLAEADVFLRLLRKVATAKRR